MKQNNVLLHIATAVRNKKKKKNVFLNNIVYFPTTLLDVKLTYILQLMNGFN